MTSIRLAAAQSIVALLTAMTNPNTNQPLFSLTKLGAVFDVGNNATWAEVTHYQGRSVHAGSGGNTIGWRIDDVTLFDITCGAGPYELDSSGAQTNMLTIMDVVLPALHSHYQLPNASNPTVALPFAYSTLTDQPDKSVPVRIGAHVWLLWSLKVEVKNQYSVQLSTP